MAAITSSAATSGTTTTVTLSYLSTQINQTYTLLAALFSVMVIIFVSVMAAFSWMCLKKRTRKSNSRSDLERAIPMTTVINTCGNAVYARSPPPPSPARSSARPAPPLHKPTVPASATVGPSHVVRSNTAPLPLKQRPDIVPTQFFGADYSNGGRGRRYDDQHLANSGPARSVNPHNNSAYETPGSRKLDRINNS